MPFRDLSPRARRRLRLLLGGIYGWAAYAGLSVLIWPPNTIEGTIGRALTYTWGAVSLVAGIVALIGVMRDRYRIEWAATWLCFAGTGIYAATVWSLVADTITRQAQAAALTALTLWFVYRGTELAAHATKLRRRHAIAVRLAEGD